MKYDKLVRDKIPEIIEKDGKKAVTRMLSDEAYKIYLEKKLDEEVAEFHESKSLEELADILEVVYALSHAYGHDPIEVFNERCRKACERGKFAKRILLEEVHDEREEKA